MRRVRDFYSFHFTSYSVFMYPGSRSILFFFSLNAKERIISTAPSITEMLAYFEQDENVIAVSDYCSFPKNLCEKEKIGSMITLNMEKLIKLKPSMVYTLELKNTKQNEKLKKLNINFTELSFNNLNDIKKSFKKMGKVLQKEVKADLFLKDVNKEILLLPKASKNKTVAIVIGANVSHGKIKSFYLAGKNTYFDDILTSAGYKNILNEEISYPNLSLEQFIKKNPDIILIVETKTSKETREAFKSLSFLKAIKENKISFINGRESVIPGPSLLTLIQKIRESL